MNNSLGINIVRFILLVFLQVFVLNNIEISNHIIPYIYILFIILLPVDIPGWALLLIAFIMGLIIDLFSGTLGFHVFATVLMAYSRKSVLTLISPRDGYESSAIPNVASYGFVWFVKYTAVMVFIHRFSLFLLEVFRFSYIPIILFRTLLSGLFSLSFLLISQYFTFNKQ